MKTSGIIGILVASALLAACQTEEKAYQEVRPVRSIVAQPGSAENRASYSGEVHARYEAQLAFRVPGKIVERLVETGDHVRTGQALMRIDARDSALQYTAARAQYEQAKADYQRAVDLRGKGFVSQAQVDARSSALAAAEAQFHLSDNQQGYTVLRADRDGVITGRMADIGQVVAAGQQVLAFAGDGEREVAISIPESRVKEIKEARELNVTLWAKEGMTYPAKVRQISPDTDPATRTYSARVTVLKPDADLQLGMTATVNVRDGYVHDRFAVPLTALYDVQGQPQLWIVDEKSKTVSLRSVSVANPEGESVWVTSGLKAGERVVTAGVHMLHAGEHVELLAEAGK